MFSLQEVDWNSEVEYWKVKILEKVDFIAESFMAIYEKSEYQIFIWLWGTPLQHISSNKMFIPKSNSMGLLFWKIPLWCWLSHWWSKQDQKVLVQSFTLVVLAHPVSIIKYPLFTYNLYWACMRSRSVPHHCLNQCLN